MTVLTTMSSIVMMTLAILSDQISFGNLIAFATLLLAIVSVQMRTSYQNGRVRGKLVELETNIIDMKRELMELRRDGVDSTICNKIHASTNDNLSGLKDDLKTLDSKIDSIYRLLIKNQ